MSTQSGHEPRARTRARIAFGNHDGWTPRLRSKIDHTRYDVSFADFTTIDPAGFDALLPLRLEDYAIASQRPELVGRKIFLPDPRTVALCHDKLALTRVLDAAGFAANVPALRTAGPPYPYVWKRRIGQFGRHCLVVRDRAAEDAIDRADLKWFAQAALPDAMEWATHILRVDGRVRYVSSVRHEMAEPLAIKGANAKPIKQTRFAGCEHLDVFAKILECLEYEGTACFDYKVIEGVPVIMEINPRFGGSLAGDITNYADAYLAALASASNASSALELA